MKVTTAYQKYVVIPDIHAPYQDKNTLQAINHFIAEQKPDHVVLIGDVIDMYSISKYDKNPLRAHKLQEEIDEAHNVIVDIRAAAGKNTPITYIEGNHEDRLRRYMWNHPEVHGLRNLELPALLGLKELGVEYKTELLVNGVFLFTHGKRTTMYSSRWELQDNGISGMSGHVHRIQTHAQTDRSGVKAWYGIGHVADEKQCEYTTNPNWQQGLGVVYFHPSKKRFHAEVIPIVEHKFIYAGKLYTPKGVENT